MGGKEIKKVQTSHDPEKADSFENTLRRVTILLEVYPHFKTYFEKRMQDEIQQHVFFNSKRRENYSGELHKTFHMNYEGVERMLELAPIEVSPELTRLKKENSNNLLGIIFSEIARNENYYAYKEYSRQTREELK